MVSIFILAKQVEFKNRIFNWGFFMKDSYKPTIMIDLDGVLNNYTKFENK